MAKKKIVKETPVEPVELPAEPVDETIVEIPEPENQTLETIEPPVEAPAAEPAPVEPPTLPMDEAIALGEENCARILDVAATTGAPYRELVCRMIKQEPGTITDGQEFDYYITGFPDGTTGAELV